MSRTATCLLTAACCLSACCLFADPALSQDNRNDQDSADKKKIVFMAGRPSHGYGSHEHNAGCLLLAKSLQQSVDGVEVVVHQNGWPQADDAFDGADVLVMYCDGGGRHPVNEHLEQVDALAKKGVGIICIHYGVEVPKGAPGDKFLEWIGGYFETHWSVNPHWTAEFKKLPEHPITRGVKPFEINDEWYYHMRFREDMEGVTPILTAVPPASTLQRPDGAHSGNPHVRKKAGQPQHVAWAAERPDGGRGFGFTGGHYHWNWADDNFRRVVLNAILWCAKMEVPEGGVTDKRPTLEELEANQDEQPRPNFNRQEIKQKFNLDSAAAPARRGPAPKPIFKSPVVTSSTPGKAVAVEADIRGARELYLVVNDGGNGYACDWADWAEPTLVGPGGKQKKLTELKWTVANSGWGQVRINQNAGGGPLRIDGKPVAFGIGTHANSVIGYELPEGYERLVAKAGLDNGGTDQGNCGATASVQFEVYTSRPATPLSPGASGGGGAASRDPADAVAGLDVHEGLEARLFASEPDLLSLTNLDVDHRGRVWVCEVVNYRRHNGKRPEGDRVLILEDTDGDGRADKTKVYYQGRDIDSAMGICVLGNRVIVSSSPNVWVFTDEDGDDRPDKKELLFSNTGQPQHDHSAHSFLFGPDGKLYWNFGNTGKAVHDAQGSVVVDMQGNPVVDNGKPYFGGMPFRCDLDGGNFEVLAHNFRNNYEVTVDSFGTLWQSDNDDDGNRGVRINYVMEFGNYGYREEGTGRGWREPRTGMHEEIPKRHWHLNDPGVVPNLLQTGAGSPCGITVYEGRLLPKVFWDEVIHCDAGPNVVRAYPVEPYGAGYTAEMVDILHGARDNWFRPADVCVGTDGSLFVTDWYDPGVGGHNMQDLQRGRLFRVAPPGHKYDPPPIDVSSIEGAIDALQNPNQSARYLAWTALHQRGDEAEPALAKLYESSENPRVRARALWLLGNIANRESHWIEQAAGDENPNLRIVAVRLARQKLDSPIQLVSRLVRDPSPAVRRECAIALRGSDSEDAPRLWAELARQLDAGDRWQLEALGIGAAGQWDAFLDAYLSLVPDATSNPAGREIIWRSRAARTPALLVELLNTTREVSEAARWLRAFDFQSGPTKDAALLELAFASQVPATVRDFVSAEAVKRLGNLDVKKNPKYAQALDQMLDRVRGQQQFVDLVAQFNLDDHYGELVELARENPDNSLGVAAVTTLTSKQQLGLLREGLADEDPRKAAALATAMANAGGAVGLLQAYVLDESADLELRRQATRGVARSKGGAEKLLQLARDKQLPEALVSSAASALSSSPLPEIRDEALKIFPPPPAKGNEVVPPIRELVKRQGDAQAGAQVFATSAQCASCHMVNKQGKEVGPDLSEIGKKLSREAMFESIIYPSAGISHNYENYLVQLEDGTSLNGILQSKTDEQIVIKTDKAIVRTIPTDEIARMKRLEISLMPADLQKQMTVQDIINVVEYLTTLRP